MLLKLTCELPIAPFVGEEPKKCPGGDLNSHRDLTPQRILSPVWVFNSILIDVKFYQWVTTNFAFLKTLPKHQSVQKVSNNLLPEAGLEPAQRFNSPTDFKSVVSAIPPLGHDFLMCCISFFFL